MRTHVRYNFGNLIVGAVVYDSENELRTRIQYAERATMLETEHDAPSVFLVLEGRRPGGTRDFPVRVVVRAGGRCPATGPPSG